MPINANYEYEPILKQYSDIERDYFHVTNLVSTYTLMLDEEGAIFNICGLSCFEIRNGTGNRGFVLSPLEPPFDYTTLPIVGLSCYATDDTNMPTPNMISFPYPIQYKDKVWALLVPLVAPFPSTLCITIWGYKERK